MLINNRPHFPSLGNFHLDVAQISVTLAYVSDHCTLPGICLGTCLENIKYETVLYTEDGSAESVDSESQVRECFLSYSEIKFVSPQILWLQGVNGFYLHTITIYLYTVL